MKLKVITDKEGTVIFPEEPAPYDDAGKCLFFSQDKKLLVKLGKQQVNNYESSHADIRNPINEGGDYVLMLYYRDDSRINILAGLVNKEYPGVQFRGWKSTAESKAGQVSQKFFDSMSSRQRKERGAVPKGDFVEARAQKVVKVTEKSVGAVNAGGATLWVPRFALAPGVIPPQGPLDTPWTFKVTRSYANNDFFQLWASGAPPKARKA